MLALLVARFRRLDLAEDALGEAFEAAARTWPRDGVPQNPAAWLMTVARRRALDRLRAEAVAVRTLPLLAVDASLTEEAQRVMVDDGARAHDERLRLVLLCTHPALPPEASAALALRLVMGVSTADLARLFLVPQPTMAARLTRARKRLAGEAFVLPEGEVLDQRLMAAADVAYLAFTAGYAPDSGADVVRAVEAGEALRLVRVLREVAPGPSDDLDALLALMLLQHSRRDARVAAGRLVLLPDQDRSRWHHDEIVEALALLTPLVRDAPATPWLLQALVAASHAVARTAAETDWPRIAGWYAELEALTGSPVVRLNRAVALAEADGPDAGLRLLDGLDPTALPGHRLPGVRGELLARSGRHEEARAAFDEAIDACASEPEREHLTARRQGLSGFSPPRA